MTRSPRLRNPNQLHQGNCISKEREEFDEIILIPGGFFEFSA